MTSKLESEPDKSFFLSTGRDQAKDLGPVVQN